MSYRYRIPASEFSDLLSVRLREAIIDLCSNIDISVFGGKISNIDGIRNTYVFDIKLMPSATEAYDYEKIFAFIVGFFVCSGMNRAASLITKEFRKDVMMPKLPCGYHSDKEPCVRCAVLGKPISRTMLRPLRCKNIPCFGCAACRSNEFSLTG